MRIRNLAIPAAAALLAACGGGGDPEVTQYGPNPDLPEPQRGLLPNMDIASPAGWGDRWAVEGEPPPLLVHDACGAELEQLLRCPRCGVEVTPTHIRSRHPA